MKARQTLGFCFKRKKITFLLYYIVILINKNQNNLITVTLLEKATLDSPVYLFRFTNDVQGNAVRFIATNISAYNSRYDQFLITETSGTTNLTSGVIELSPAGSWSYSIYEQTSLTNLNENLATGIVETGKVKVVGSDTVTNAFGDTPTTYIAYDGS